MHGQLDQHLRSSLPKRHPPTPKGICGNFGETRGQVGKSDYISETRKDRGKVTGWPIVAPIELTNALSNIPNRLRPHLPQYWGLQPPPKTPIAIISGTSKATKFKFGRNIRMQGPSEQKPIKNFGEKGKIN